MKGTEFLKSLQPDWHIFMKIRDEDKSPLQIVAYKLPEIDYVQRVKVLKATKDTETDAFDYEIYCNIDTSAILNDTGVSAEIDDNVSVVHSINEEYIMKESTNYPVLKSDSEGKYLLFASGDEMSFYEADGVTAYNLSSESVEINGKETTLKNTSKVTYADLVKVNYKLRTLKHT